MADKKPTSKEHAIVTFGRMNPITTGHAKLITKVKELAKHHGADHHIFASPSHDDKKNPLTHHDKVKFLQDMFPGTNVYNKTDVKHPLEMMKHLEKEGHKKVTVVVGEDRVKEFKNLLHKYNGEQYNFDQINVVSAGHRDPDAEGIEGISGSKMREFAKKGDFKSFSKGVPSKKHAKELFMATRKGMKTESFHAIFLLGGPCSGKDVLLRETALGDSNLIEFSLNKLYEAILEKKDIVDINDGAPLVVNGNADDHHKVLIAKNVLEAVGYKTAAVFVFTTDEVSHARNDQRIKLGARTFNEEMRSDKYQKSIQTLNILNEKFDLFMIFDNSHNMTTLNEEDKSVVESWIVELNEIIRNFFRGEKSLDEQVAEFLEESKENENTANQLLSQTQRMGLQSALKTSVAGGQNDYFNHNANKERSKTSRTQANQKIPAPAMPVKTGPTNEGFKAFVKVKKESKTKAAKPPVQLGDIRQGDGMGGATTTLATESTSQKKSLLKIKEETTNKSPAEEYGAVEVYEDWGIDGQEVMFEGRVVRTNKPFKTKKGHAVYVTDGINVNRLEFNRKATTLQETVEQTDVRFWERLK